MQILANRTNASRLVHEYAAMGKRVSERKIDKLNGRAEKLANAQAYESAAPEEAAESTAVNTDPAEHTASEQSVIQEYQNAVDDGFAEYIQNIRDNGTKGVAPYELKPVSDRAADDIKRITGVDTRGSSTKIEARMVDHILKDHGENGKADRSMRDINDIARIQYVLDNYDSAEDGGSSKAYQTVKQNDSHRKIQQQSQKGRSDHMNQYKNDPK